MIPHSPPERAIEHASRRVASTPVGSPFDMGPCKAQAHRIEFSGTMAGLTAIMATCPGAAISTTSQGCGKNCIADQTTITPDSSSPIPSLSDPTKAGPKLPPTRAPAMTRDQAESIQAQIRILHAEMAESQRKLDALSALAQSKAP